jgi:hypothetical protein
MEISDDIKDALIRAHEMMQEPSKIPIPRAAYYEITHGVVHFYTQSGSLIAAMPERAFNNLTEG